MSDKLEALEKAVASLEEERDYYKREWIGVQEMLAHVLNSVGKPVTVTFEQLNNGIDSDTGIVVDMNQDAQAFIFSLGSEVDNHEVEYESD